ncbi:pyruvoyl-dependent arginine decarboxylase [Nocardia sp. NPDC052566]|uniref:pyruvoyl-dependent arginine decarboxylase n=1 Tax=Nocardia sp. NPDC052566 TaxID=3364330 RepID=UPI0037C67776
MIHTTPRSGLMATARSGRTAQRAGVLGLQWIDRLRPPLPLTIEIGAATGAGPTAMSAFDAALRDLGVGDANLIRLSSVIPPRAVLEHTNRVRKPIAWGDRLYCVYAAQHASEPGETAAAGIGWVLRDDDSGAGLFVEHEADTADEVEYLVRASLADMTGNRPEGFGPVRLSITEARSHGEPVCALVLAAYHSVPWGRRR